MGGSLSMRVFRESIYNPNKNIKLELPNTQKKNI
jgi:hypothetical protein